jgi:hypothetical protein
MSRRCALRLLHRVAMTDKLATLYMTHNKVVTMVRSDYNLTIKHIMARLSDCWVVVSHTSKLR